MFPILSTALVTVDAFNLTAVRYLLAAAILVAILAWREGAAALRPEGRTGGVLLLGVLGFAAFNLLTNLALGAASPQNVALFAATAPVITQFVRRARDGVRPGGALLALSVAAFAGVALVITRGRLDGLPAVGGGELISVAGTLAIVAATLVADLAGRQDLPALSDLAAVAPQLTYLVLIAAVAAVLAMNTGARRLGPANAALYMNLVAANLVTRPRVTPEPPLAVDHLPVSPAALLPAARRRAA